MALAVKYALTDALGLPVNEGQAAGITQAVPVMEGVETAALLADKGYDSDKLIQWLSEHEIQVAIPPKANRRVPRECDWWLYKERHVIECMFGNLRHYRLFFSRFEKKAINYMGILALAVTML